ncbi:hypothetical protein N9Y89_00150 [bacterium]|nr:hypothetical protein [bacterium]
MSIHLFGQEKFNSHDFLELRAGNGYWANKFGVQIGFKCFDLFGYENLSTNFRLALIPRMNTTSPANIPTPRNDQIIILGHSNEEDLVTFVISSSLENILVVGYLFNDLLKGELGFDGFVISRI